MGATSPCTPFLYKKNFESEKVKTYGGGIIATMFTIMYYGGCWRNPRSSITSKEEKMKQETKGQYGEEVYKGKKLLRECLEDAQVGGKQEEWSDCWRKLEVVDGLLQSVSPDTVTTYNLLKNTMRRVKRLAGHEGEEVEIEPETPEVEPDSPQDQIIKHVQAASTALINAYNIACERSPLIEAIPLFQKMKVTAAELNQLPREIAKMRGLQ